MIENIFSSGGNSLVYALIIAVWTLPWKGVALWRAVKRKETAWFVALLVLNTLAILEIIYIFIFSKRPQKKSKLVKDAVFKEVEEDGQTRRERT